MNDVEKVKLPHFGVEVPKAVPGVAEDVVLPGWDSKIEYTEELGALAIKYGENFDQKYKGKLGNF